MMMALDRLATVLLQLVYIESFVTLHGEKQDGRAGLAKARLAWAHKTQAPVCLQLHALNAAWEALFMHSSKRAPVL